MKNKWERVLTLILVGAAAVVFVAGAAVKNPVTPAMAQAGTAVPILMYHSVCADPSKSGDYVITPTLFKQDMQYLRDKGYTSIFVSDLISHVYDGTALPDKPVIVTLDDGYLNSYTEVLPILQELDMKAVVSVVGEFTENFTEKPDRNPYYAHMTWDDIKALADSGNVEIGNHTYSMHRLSPRKGSQQMSSETAPQYQAVLSGDLSKLQDNLTMLSGVTPQVFTYPYGLMTGNALQVIKSLGFKAALTCEGKINYITGDPEELYNLGRFNRPSGIATAQFMQRLTGTK